MKNYKIIVQYDGSKIEINPSQVIPVKLLCKLFGDKENVIYVNTIVSCE
ncbi:hypothetical protein DFR58_105103 [Anaerobacterium chartisolvens]|uniref:Uncharacterized protein n=1 Tax=Anaerobacterium chartisolvens TaxID=1297424 RepID=A0A369B9X6_9FIRM|nr:hypothetical protein DFR58_105103 [Anaerobacterium chartisolvens]